MVDDLNVLMEDDLIKTTLMFLKWQRQPLKGIRQHRTPYLFYSIALDTIQCIYNTELGANPISVREINTLNRNQLELVNILKSIFRIHTMFLHVLTVPGRTFFATNLVYSSMFRKQIRISQNNVNISNILFGTEQFHNIECVWRSMVRRCYMVTLHLVNFSHGIKFAW